MRDARAPDYAAPLAGWRAWRVVRTRAGPRLWSVVYDVEWPPGAELRAGCARPGEEHDAPEPSCACGVYAAADRDEAARYLVGRDDPWVERRAVGLVSLWGVVAEAAAGWRASTAYPARIWLAPAPDRGTEDLVAGLGAYGVPVAILAPWPRRSASPAYS